MILSVSRRTDIPTFYSDWFFNRVKEKSVCVRNPMNRYQVSRIDISPEVVDCIVFWTKDPKPMLGRLDELKDYKYYFQYSVNGYEQDLEPHISPLQERIKIFQNPFDVIITDMWYPKEAGGEEDRCGLLLLDEMKKSEYNIPVIICSNQQYRTEDALGEVLFKGNGDWDEELLVSLVKRAKEVE